MKKLWKYIVVFLCGLCTGALVIMSISIPTWRAEDYARDQRGTCVQLPYGELCKKDVGAPPYFPDGIFIEYFGGNYILISRPSYIPYNEIIGFYGIIDGEFGAVMYVASPPSEQFYIWCVVEDINGISEITWVDKKKAKQEDIDIVKKEVCMSNEFYTEEYSI